MAAAGMNHKVEDAADVQKARLGTDENQTDNFKTNATQTAEMTNNYKQNLSMKGSFSLPSCLYMEQKRSAMVWSIDEDPAPQWFLEKALNKGSEVCAEYETKISALQKELNDVKIKFKEAVEQKNAVKNRYERVLENIKIETDKQYEIMQEKVMEICISIMEKFQTCIYFDKKEPKGYKNVKFYGKLSKKLRKKLERNSEALIKLKQELSQAKAELHDKSEKFDLLDEWYTKLKEELDTTKSDMQNLMTENSSLLKKLEENQQCTECKVKKEQNEKNNPTQNKDKDTQRSREFINLKKKTEEDSTTITQLRNKLQRLESTNNNKNSLINNYKNQINDLEKKKDQCSNKIKTLERENNNLRNTIVQLKIKVPFLNKEK